MFKDEIYLNLSEHVYSGTYTIVEGYQQVIIPFFTDENGYFIEYNFACAAYKNGNKVIISFRGTDDSADLLISDLGIVLDNIPLVSFMNAQKFYLQVQEYFKDEDVEIEFTGHSLGGAIAQLMGGLHGNKTVTFNAPGMLTMMDQIGCSTTAEYENITNYAVLNDYVGNFRAHAGDTYYIPPIPIEEEPLYDTHNGIFAYTEATHGEIFSKIPGFTTEHALALWFYDQNNDLMEVKNQLASKVKPQDLYDAILLVEEYVGNVGNLPKPLRCFVGTSGYVVGSNKDDIIVGRNTTNDIIWGNQGYNNMGAGAGDDQIFGGSGADVMVGGKGNDTYFVDSTYDKIVELQNDGIDTVNVTYSYTLADNFENLNLLTESNLNGTGNSADNIINGNSGDNVLKGLAGDDIIYGADGNDSLYGGIGDDIYMFSAGDGNDIVSDDAGIEDIIQFDNSVESSNIAIFKDGNDLIIDYGNSLGEDSIIVKNQEFENNTVERIQLSDGKYLSNEDINKIIQNMTSYAANNGIEFTNIESVKNNEDLMNLVASSWHV